MSTKRIGSIAVVVLGCGLIGVLAWDFYVESAGYSAVKIEREICREGRRLILVEDGIFSPVLRCTSVAKGKPLPRGQEDLPLSPLRRFTLGQIENLCGPDQKPTKLNGQLGCVLE